MLLRLNSSRRYAQPVLAGAVAIALATAPAAAQAPYAGKNITMIVGSGAGGGFDLYGRLVGRFLTKHIPGNPNVIVQNMPGAGSMKATEYIYAVAPKDGLTIGIVFPGAIVEPLISSDKKFRFEPPKLSYLGSANSGTRLCITHHTSKTKTFDDALKQETTMGGSAPGDSTTDYSQMFNSLAGTKFKIVTGYKSSNAIVLAIERGEVDGLCGFDAASFRAQRPDWYSGKLANMIVQAGITPDPELTRLGVPSIWKYVTGENRKVAELILSQQEFHRPFIAPPNIPADRLEILRKAFDATVADKEFLEAAAKSKLDIAPKSGAVVAKLVTEMYAAPKELVVRIRQALRR
ncbi:MAG: Bug family tripartite tricarboxylate transporter substrate binding protein [Hyphomicrobiaceae bacterium]